MIKYVHGKLKLPNTIIDVRECNRYPRVREEHLERHYDDFLERVPMLAEHFTDAAAFSAVHTELYEKRPKFIPREPEYSFFWKRTDPLASLLEPEKRRLGPFLVARCLISMHRGASRKETQNPDLSSDVADAFSLYPDHDCIIEIPDEDSPAQIKGSVFHESLHYALTRYQVKTGRAFTDALVKDMSPTEQYRAEYFMEERAVMVMTDKLLQDDPLAQFETRWVEYQVLSGVQSYERALSAMAAGVFVGLSPWHLYFLPMAILPTLAAGIVTRRRIDSLREKLLVPREYADIKL